MAVLHQGHAPLTELQPCGTNAAYRRHRYYGEQACRECLNATTVYEVARHRRLGIGPRYVAQCGTHSGYTKHIRNGETACLPCRKAHVVAVIESRDKMRRKKRRGTIPTVIEDYVETYGPMELRELVMLIQLRHDIPEESIRRSANRMMTSGRLIRGVDIVRGDTSEPTLGRVPSGMQVAYSV